MKTVAVFFGGRSAEHDVSIITAHIPIIESLQAAGGYDIWPVYIAKDGSWYADKAMLDLAYFQKDLEQKLGQLKKIRLGMDGGLQLVWPGLTQKAVSIDVAFPAMHGTYGEDGSLMGLLRMAGIPFVGCDLFASAVAMDKVLTKQVLAAEEIPVVPYVWMTRHEWESHRADVLKKAEGLRFPLFIKPVHLGSSIGISVAKDVAGLENALEVGFHYDDKVLVEEGVQNLIEVTLPLMGNEEPRTAGIERALNKTEFFDFSEKYLSGGGKSTGVNSQQYSEIPANIAPGFTEKVLELGKKTYRTLGCSGIARVDFLIDAVGGTVFVNEVNTLPGSLYHHNWRQVGVSGVELVTTLIRLAEERFANQNSSSVIFQSDILQKVGGGKMRQ